MCGRFKAHQLLWILSWDYTFIVDLNWKLCQLILYILYFGGQWIKCDIDICFQFWASFFFLISWRPITLQYCSGSCHTLTWISLEPAFCLTFIYCSLSVTRILSKEPQRETVNTFFSLFLKVEAIPHSLSSEGNDNYFQTIWHRVEEFLQKIISTCLIFGG